MAEEIKKKKKKKEKKAGRPERAAARAKVKGSPKASADAAGASATTEGGTAAPAVRIKKKIKRNVANGIVHIQATFNNTIITLTDTQGNVLSWATSGGKGFKGSKKGTSFAAQLASETACRKAATDFGMRTVSVHVRGPGAGRESAVRAISHAGLRVTSIRDLTPIPHNGCRPPKKRRV